MWRRKFPLEIKVDICCSAQSRIHCLPSGHRPSAFLLGIFPFTIACGPDEVSPSSGPGWLQDMSLDHRLSWNLNIETMMVTVMIMIIVIIRIINDYRLIHPNAGILKIYLDSQSYSYLSKAYFLYIPFGYSCYPKGSCWKGVLISGIGYSSNKLFSLKVAMVVSAAREAQRDMPTQNVLLWHIDYFDLQALEMKTRKCSVRLSLNPLYFLKASSSKRNSAVTVPSLGFSPTRED